MYTTILATETQRRSMRAACAAGRVAGIHTGGRTTRTGEAVVRSPVWLPDSPLRGAASSAPAADLCDSVTLWLNNLRRTQGCSSSWLRADDDFHRADLLDGRRHHVAWFDWRDAFRSAGDEHIARMQRVERRRQFDQLRHAENQVAGV